MHSRLLVLVLILSCGIAFAAPPKPAASDAAIEASLRQRLGRSKIAADNFQYTVQGGVVTWTGKTDVIQHKGAATRMAKAAGARRVENRIQISEAARKKASARFERARQRDGSRRTDIPLKRAQVGPGA